jgi:glycosyltransferase involved in cell wall biosynthesis
MITFIIPTVGRTSLKNTINSLLNQKDPDWKAIVIFDGAEKIEYDDQRIQSIKIDKIGKLNHAGQVRNYGLKLVTTEWVGFVDDDDTVSDDYVSRFKEEIFLNPDAKCIIFRMKTIYDRDQILPAPHHNNFIKNKVGISFAMKKDLNLFFEPSIVEDYLLLDKIRTKSHLIIISPYVTYFVREMPSITQIYKRSVINY